MSDTVRALSAILALIPVGTVGGTVAQDIRDLADSAIGVVPAVSAAKTSAYTLTDDDVWVTVDATAGAVACAVPAWANTRAGKFWIVQKIDSGGNGVSAARSSTDTLNGATSKSTTTQWNALLIIRAPTSGTYACFTLTGS